MNKKEVDRLKLATEEDPLLRIPLLNSIALASQRTEVSSAIELLREALSLCGLVAIPLYTAQTRLNLSRWLGNGGFFEEAFIHLSQAEFFFREKENPDGLQDVELVKALILFEKGEFDKAFERASFVYHYRREIQNTHSSNEPTLVSTDRFSGEQVSEERSRRNNELKLAIATRILAMVEASRMDFFKALYYLDANSELWDHLGETQEFAASLNNAGMVYARVPDYLHATQFFERALVVYRSTDSMSDIIITLANLADIRTKTGDYPVALTKLNEAQNMIPHSNSPPAEIAVSLQFAKYYIATKDFRSASDWVLKARETAENEGVQYSFGQIFSLSGKILFYLGEYAQAIEMLENGLKLAKDFKQLGAEVRCVKYLYLAHKNLNRLDDAFTYLERYQTLESRLLKTQRKSNSEALQLRFNARFAETGEAVFRQEKRELTKEVERLTDELAGWIRQVRKKDEVLGKLKIEGFALMNYSQETQKLLRPILTEINKELREADFEKNVAEKLQEVQTHFLRTLRQKFPSLSNAEARICALIRLEMSSPQIAALLDISVRTVENHRLHIRQKLQLDENQSIQDAIKETEL